MTERNLKYDFDKEALLEIRVRSSSHILSKVDPDVFRSWSGYRQINGKRYCGPTYYYLSNNIASTN